MSVVQLGELMATKTPSLNPAQFQHEEFELWSIPAFDAGSPEQLTGSEIGSAKKIIQPGDVLLSRIVPHIRRSWVVSESTDGLRQIGSGEWIIFRSKRVDPNYLRHFLISDVFHPQFMQTVAGVGGSLLRARPEGVKEISFFLPPLAEQKRIAAILDQADELRRKRKQALDRLNKLGQAIFIEMFGDPQKNPFGLSQCMLGDVVHSASDGPHVSPTYADNGVPFLSTRHVKPGEIVWRDLKYLTLEDAEVQWKKCRPQVGDLLYTKGGTTGIAAVVDTENPFSVWVHVALLKTDHARVEPLWLETMLNCDFCYRQSQTLTHGIANRDLGLKRMVNIKMYLPSLHDQRKFVERLQVVRATRSNMRLAEESGQFFFASLQHRAFSGELTASSLEEAAA